MRQLRFTGFRKLCEDATDYQDEEKDLGNTGKGDFQKSNMDGVLAHDLNIIPGNNDDKMDMAMGATVSLSGHGLKQFNKLMGFDDEHSSMKLIRVIQRNKYGVQIEDISGKCDKDGLNQGRDGPGRLRPARTPTLHVVPPAVEGGGSAQRTGISFVCTSPPVEAGQVVWVECPAAHLRAAAHPQGAAAHLLHHRATRRLQ